MSGSGPRAPIFIGVWQSSQPMTPTRYLPRASSGEAPKVRGFFGGSPARATDETARVAAAAARAMRRTVSAAWRVAAMIELLCAEESVAPLRGRPPKN